MAQSNKTTIEVTHGQKDVVKSLQQHFEEEFGTKPTQGEAVAIAGERIIEGGSA